MFYNIDYCKLVGPMRLYSRPLRQEISKCIHLDPGIWPYFLAGYRAWPDTEFDRIPNLVDTWVEALDHQTIFFGLGKQPFCQSRYPAVFQVSVTGGRIPESKCIIQSSF